MEKKRYFNARIRKQTNKDKGAEARAEGRTGAGASDVGRWIDVFFPFYIDNIRATFLPSSMLRFNNNPMNLKYANIGVYLQHEILLPISSSILF